MKGREICNLENIKLAIYNSEENTAQSSKEIFRLDQIVSNAGEKKLKGFHAEDYPIFED